MKKLIFALSIVVGITLLSISAYSIIDTNENPKEIHNESKAKPNKSEEEVEVLDEVEQEHGYKLYRPEQTIKVDGAKNDLTINKGSDEAAVIQDMHEMTHQKKQLTLQMILLRFFPINKIKGVQFTGDLNSLSTFYTH